MATLDALTGHRIPRHSPSGRVALTLFALLAACAPKGEALYARAEQSLAKGEVGAAVIDLKNLVEAEPQNARARALLATASLRSGDLQGAEIEVRKAKDLGAPAAMTLGTECRILAIRGQLQVVLSQCVADSAPAEARTDVRVARGQALLALGRTEDARQQFQQARQADAGSLDALLGLAQIAGSTSGLPAARAVLDGASDDVKKVARYWIAVGQVSSEGGDFAGAEKAYATAFQIAEAKGAAGERIMSMAGLADSQMRQGKMKEAQATADKLAQAAPDNTTVKLVRAQVAAAAGDLEKSRTLLEGVLSTQPNNTQARTMLGMINMRQGNLGQAEMNLATVVANDPSDVRAQRLLAETRARLQSPKATLESLKPALDQNPDPSLLAMAGRLSMATGDQKQAVAYLSQATARQDVRPTPEVQLEIASGFIAAGEFDRAIELLRAMPRSGAGTGYQREYLLISALLRKGDKDGAMAEAKALLQSSGDDPEARNLIAGVYASTGQRDAGREQLNEALRLKPNDVSALLNLARLDLAEGKTADAENRFRKVLEIDPQNLQATLGAAMAAGAGGDKAGAERWLLKAAADHPESLDAKVALVRYYISSGSVAKAQALIDEAVKKQPENAALANLRGLLQLATKDAPGAIKSLSEAVRLAPTEPEYVMNLARAKVLTGDAKGALPVMDEFLASNPRNGMALQLAAAVALQAHETEKAAGYVERWRQVAPDSPGLDRVEGDLAMAQRRYKDALKSYRKAGERGRDGALVLAEYSAGRLAGAAEPEKVVEDWVAQHPEDGAAVAIVAESKRNAGNADAAIALYEAGLAKSPNDMVMLNNLAVLYQEKSDPRAVEVARRAYNLAPKVPAIADTYGWVLVGAGQLEEGTRLLASAAQAEPNAAEIQYHYAAALARSGRNAEALPILKKALAGQLAPAVRTDAQKLLKQLSK